MADELTVREAIQEDRIPIWEWWNDPVTRQMMRQHDFVPLKVHNQWFAAVLKDHARILCVGFVGSEKIGVVRFDWRAEDIYEASLNLNPQHRGLGYAPRILRASIDYLRTVRCLKMVYAPVKKINIPSEKSFLRAGFNFVANPALLFPEISDIDTETQNYFELKIEGSK